MTKQEEIYEAYLIRQFDELNRIKKSVSFEEVKEKAKEYRVDMYLYGWLDTLYALGYNGDEYPVTIEEALFAADRETAGKTPDERLDEWIEKVKEQGIEIPDDGKTPVPVTPEMETVIETEGHRGYVDGQQGAAEAVAEENSSYITKRWDATMDEKTRDTHFILNGTEIPLDDYFISASGDRAKAPGGFLTAQENANCRCILAFTEYKA